MATPDIIYKPWPQNPSKTFVDSLEQRNIHDLPDGEQTCIICFDEYSTDETLGKAEHPVAMPCGHVFGEACLRTWSTDKKGCPICRRIYSTTGVYLGSASAVDETVESASETLNDEDSETDEIYGSDDGSDFPDDSSDDDSEEEDESYEDETESWIAQAEHALGESLRDDKTNAVSDYRLLDVQIRVVRQRMVTDDEAFAVYAGILLKGLESVRHRLFSKGTSVQDVEYATYVPVLSKAAINSTQSKRVEMIEMQRTVKCASDSCYTWATISGNPTAACHPLASSAKRTLIDAIRLLHGQRVTPWELRAAMVRALRRDMPTNKNSHGAGHSDLPPGFWLYLLDVVNMIALGHASSATVMVPLPKDFDVNGLWETDDTQA